jgi:hypothetical protein
MEYSLLVVENKTIPTSFRLTDMFLKYAPRSDAFQRGCPLLLVVQWITMHLNPEQIKRNKNLSMFHHALPVLQPLQKQAVYGVKSGRKAGASLRPQWACTQGKISETYTTGNILTMPTMNVSAVLGSWRLWTVCNVHVAHCPVPQSASQMCERSLLVKQHR